MFLEVILFVLVLCKGWSMSCLSALLSVRWELVDICCWSEVDGEEGCEFRRNNNTISVGASQDVLRIILEGLTVDHSHLTGQNCQTPLRLLG